MNVECEFKWLLDDGSEILIEAEGCYLASDDSVWPVLLGFIIKPIPESMCADLFRQIRQEYDLMHCHARNTLLDRAREILAESKGESA